MQAKDFQQILGADIPNALAAVSQLEASLAPILVSVNKHRDQIDPSLLAKYDEAMAEMGAAKEKLREHGDFNS